MKIKLVLAVAAFACVFTACKKERTCECTSTGTSTYIDSQGNPYTDVNEPETTTTTYKKAKKSKLGTLCGDTKQTYTSSTTISEDGNVTKTSNSNTYETKCKLK